MLEALNWKLFLFGQFPDGHIGGLAINILMSVAAFFFGLLMALVLSLGRMARTRMINVPAAVYVHVIRCTPLLLIVFWFYFLIPVFFDFSIDVLWSALIALSVYASANLAEILRAGILSIPKGQYESARALGMSYMQTMRNVVVPQAFKNMIPCFFSFFISLFKDTSVLYILGVVDLLQVGVITSERRPDLILPVYLCVALGFFMVSYSVSMILKYLEHRFGMILCTDCLPEEAGSTISTYQNKGLSSVVVG